MQQPYFVAISVCIFVVDKIKNFLAEYYIDLDNGTKEFVYGRQLVRTS